MAQMRMLLQEARVGFHKQAAQKCAYRKALLTLAYLIFWTMQVIKFLFYPSHQNPNVAIVVSHFLTTIVSASSFVAYGRSW